MIKQGKLPLLSSIEKASPMCLSIYGMTSDNSVKAVLEEGLDR